ncbi:MAG: cellobiose phosphorylase [Lachnospiraceae bacterium]|nr:cellobiose phosphorylase [Lachnospiraceae bacterium]
MNQISFLDKNGNFAMKQPENYSYLYFPVAGEKGIKGAVTPNFGGDIKLNQNAFIMEPVSAENLHNNRSGRNFWCTVEGVGSWSTVGASAEEEVKKFTDCQDKSELMAGFMWHSMVRSSMKYQLTSKVTSFVPLTHNVEIMQVEICNTSRMKQTITPTAAIPIYGRSADDIRDHRHVTSLLHRIKTTKYGVEVKPTLSFDERGHQKNNITYFVCGISGEGVAPVEFYPTVDEFLGEGGSFTSPAAVLRKKTGVPEGSVFSGREAVGAFKFKPIELEPQEKVSYTVVIGATETPEEIEGIVSAFDTEKKVQQALENLKEYWQKQVNVRYYTGNERFDNFMRWVSFQPILRRIYGCSFLPHHDYGKGGRGWRDLWQDCLALLIMNPDVVRQMIVDNYGGVRMDGTNATIIGEKQGQFIADRNNITRVWMDHGVWPFMTTMLYINQTGDIEILKEQVKYFKDRQVERGTGIDEEWTAEYGEIQKTVDGEEYTGTILEHLLLQHLCAFYEVGEHNHIRLRGADWNDALDMANKKGESVAFTSAYAGNLRDLANYMTILKEQTGCTTVEILEEMQILLEDSDKLYESVQAKTELLQKYAVSCRHNVSGKKVNVDIDTVIENLRNKSEWIVEHIRKTEWVTDNEGNGWFNSYYDDHGNAVEGIFEKGVRMMLTGQVFTVMSETADLEQVKSICVSADKYLYEKTVGGYRLNTDFKEEKFDLGRMFGFAYGEKENGAVFSHMTVMYANALYKRGFVKEGYKALQTLADTALNFEVSKIYPGIPEYFDANGRGMYHYLTGAASWYMLTMITEVFGVHGEVGKMVIEPKLVSKQFDENGCASIQVNFAHKTFEIQFSNKKGLSYGEYQVGSAICDGSKKLLYEDGRVVISKEELSAMDDSMHRIEVELQ